MPGKEDRGDPDGAQDDEAGKHQQPVQHAHAGEQQEYHQHAAGAADAGHQQQHAVEIRQHLVVLFPEQAVGDETGEAELDEPGEDQRAEDQVGDGNLELDDGRLRIDDPETEETDEKDADDGQHPRTGADDAGVGIGLQQAEVALFLQQLAQFEAYACHVVASS